MKRFLTPAVRISLGLALITISLVLSGDLFGLLPNESRATLDARKKFCESLGLQFSVAVQRKDRARIQRVLEMLVERHPDVLSAAFRTVEGETFAHAGEHAANWTELSGDRSTPTHVQVPIFKGRERWGTVEVAFTSLFPGGLMGLPQRPVIRTVAYLGVAGFLAYLFFIRKTLQHLDPTSVVPARVRNTLDVLSEGVVLLDQQARIVLANGAFSEKIGADPHALVGRKITQLGWSGTRRGTIGKGPDWGEIAREGRRLSGVTTYLDCGESRKLRLVAKSSPIHDEKGKVRGLLATFNDVTELESKNEQLNQTVVLLKRSRDEVSKKNTVLERTNRIIEAKVAQRTEELRKSKEAAEAADQAKSAFLANISHELRTPMHAILSFSEFGAKKLGRVPEERLRTYFQAIQKSGSSLLVLLNDLLDLSKLQAGKMTYDRKPGDLLAALRTVVSEMRTMATEREVQIDIEETAAETVSLFDEYRIHQVIRNLLSNAIKFTHPRTRVAVTLREGQLERGGAAIPSLQVSVQDEGIGIPDDELETVFQPFTQSQRTDSGAGGTGLGLPICRQILEAHGGWIRADNRPGGGAVFTFALPLVQVEEFTTD